MQHHQSQNDGTVQIFQGKIFRALLLVVFLGFSAFTVLTLINQGVISVFENQFKTFGGIQVFLDLVIMCLLFSIWMFKDAKIHGRKFLPWFILTLVAGSLGPLLYLITSKKN